MKKITGIIVSGCLVAALAAAPAWASATPSVSPAEAQEMCRVAFSAERCESLAEQWAGVVATRDPAQIEAFARQLLADVPTSKATECRAIFSDQVCDQLEFVSATIMDIVKNPPTIDEIRYIILWLADCIVHQTCIATTPGAQAGDEDRVCREVFSDAICSKVEDPVGTVQWLYDTYIRCYLDPACTPTPNPLCTKWWCLL